MKLKSEEADLIRKYISVVDGIIAKYVPNPVPGIHRYNQMMTYLDLRKKISHIFSSEDWEKTSKWRQMTLEEGIENEKKERNDIKY